MSYIATSIKKMRKRTRIENLNNQILAQRNIIVRLLGALQIVNQNSIKLKDTNNWLTQEHHDSICPQTKEGCYCKQPLHVEYIWNGDTSPAALIEEMETTVKGLLLPVKPVSDTGTEHGADKAVHETPTPVEASLAV